MPWKHRRAARLRQQTIATDELLHSLIHAERAAEVRKRLSARSSRSVTDSRALSARAGDGAVFQLFETVAPTNSTILITETGTGKEVVAARFITTVRGDCPLVVLSIAPRFRNASGKELFGHAALSPARGRQSAGRPRQAHKGTLADEVGR
jgi:DNA-binding NtrC family response regulator